MIHDYTKLWQPRPDAKPRTLDQIQKIFIHRLELPIGYPSPMAILHEFRYGEAGKSTGYTKPYTFLAAPLGEVWQFAKLSERTSHAKDHNTMALGISVWGDFTKGDVKPLQWDALVWLCAGLCRKLALTTADIEGHTEKPGRSNDVKKVCPGEHLVLPWLRDAVGQRLLLAPDRLTGLVD